MCTVILPSLAGWVSTNPRRLCIGTQPGRALGFRSIVTARRTVLSRIISFLNDESGAAAAEYALILALITAGIATAVTGLGTAITTAIGNAATVISG